MRQLTLLLLLTLLLACSEDENKGPDCKFSKIAYGGGETRSVKYYKGDTEVRVGDGPDEGYRLFFSKENRLIRKEEPADNPYYRFLFEYNSEGQVTSVKWYNREGTNWVYTGRLRFTYKNRKMINVKGEGTVAQNEIIYDHQIIWKGNDIQYIHHRLNGEILCTTQFSYEGAIPNPMRHFSYLYFGDGDGNYVYYKLPYYFSEHLVTKQESTCSETRLFHYTFTSRGLIESMWEGDEFSFGTMWEYEYECK